MIFKGYNMFKHWKNITIYKLSREADLTDLEDKKKMILFPPVALCYNEVCEINPAAETARKVETEAWQAWRHRRQSSCVWW